ncbi:hypothetical protein KRR55_03545 [Paeniglutamicibacter sp. ABSL32-1]|uniref:AMIN-like domain-containing (lipo)protein n=1 Tax=Paeniglutamicibacter quisquiliarum TaxID=2849498 RepID=UPI001C2D3F1A|nr:hypothetical protein [Paeniglutamicibacter quisquiliarum]MBV1778189.1 hypothetical protein [Paeniglutamicibacter quisquiliarum]
MKSRIAAGLAGALLIAGLGISPVSPAATATAVTAPYCGITWGSLADSVAGYSSATITNVRTGRHTCYDRMVIDLKGRVKGYDVRYVNAVYTEGEGRHVPLAGAADLRIIVKAPAYTSSGVPTYNPANRTNAKDVSGYTTFRQVAFLGSYEGQTSFGLGVRARLPFRTFVLTAADGSTSRLVIDVAHRW